MAVFPLLALPPEERLAFGGRGSSELVPPVRWVRFPAACVSLWRLTEPPRTCGVGNEPLCPPVAGTSPFRGGFTGSATKRLPPQRELSAVRLTEDKPLCWGARYCNGRVYLPPSAAVDGPPPSAEGGKGGGEAATSYCFVPYGHEAVAFRSPPPPLRASTYRLISGLNVGRLRRLCQPP